MYNRSISFKVFFFKNRANILSQILYQHYIKSEIIKTDYVEPKELPFEATQYQMNQFNKLIKNIELSRVSINVLPRLSYEEFLGKINEGDINLVIGWNKRIDDHFIGSGVLPTKFWECLGLNVPLLVYSQNTFDEIRSVASEKYSLPIVHDYESLVTFFDSISKKVWRIDTSEFTFQTRAKQILEYINDKENI